MDAPIYVALSHMNALRREMDITTNNIANINTTAYKGEDPLFTEYLLDQPKNKDVSYVLDFGLVRNLTAGVLEKTDNPLDLAINGDGYFTVKTPQGDRYTRAGVFTLAPTGEITTKEGYPLLSDSGQPFTIPANTTSITIGTDGVVNAANNNDIAVVALGKVGLVKFAKERELKKLPSGLYETTQTATPVERPDIRQGMIEKSNVSPILSMTRMIEIERAYSNARNITTTEDERIKGAIGRLAGNKSQ
ncbi:MAG: flagellar basal-body rod protein FlgF [Holosporales bacterium]|jgi:flagellar basal-body rod protein FlgF